MTDPRLDDLRASVDAINLKLLHLLNERLEVVDEIRALKSAQGRKFFDPARESDMLTQLLLANRGPMTADQIRSIFKEIWKLSLDHMEQDERKRLRVHRGTGEHDRVYTIRGHEIGAAPQLVAGPCSVESYDQTDAVARTLKRLGVRFLRGGAFKPRTSPYAFQGLGEDALRILRQVGDAHDMAVVTEVLDPRDVELVERYADVFQVGTRNMYNYQLLRLLGQAKKPVLLKRGFMATLEEFVLAAEYIAQEGNEQILLCERGIRTHERWTRNTLDLAAIPLLRHETPFPVVIDVSHGTGRKDIMVPMARAALAAGAQAIMVEVHPNPALALSDNEQQMDLDEVAAFHADVFGAA